MEEFWDLYNAKREILGRVIKRGDMFGIDEYYIAVEIWTVNFNNQIFISRRHPDKKAGGLWEFTGGGVLSGETTLPSAKRELQEELGLSVEEDDLLFFTAYPYKNCFLDIYILRKQFEIDSLILQDNEVIDAKWISFEQLEEMIEAGTFVASVGERYRCCRDKLFILINNFPLHASDIVP